MQRIIYSYLAANPGINQNRLPERIVHQGLSRRFHGTAQSHIDRSSQRQHIIAGARVAGDDQPATSKPHRGAEPKCNVFHLLIPKKKPGNARIPSTKRDLCTPRLS